MGCIHLISIAVLLTIINNHSNSEGTAWVCPLIHSVYSLSVFSQLLTELYMCDYCLTGAPHVDFLCKTMVMQNTRFEGQPEERKANPSRENAQYYMVVVQYTAKMNSEKLNRLIRASSGMSKKHFNFRLCPPEINDELTGFSHNGVTPLGSKQKLHIILSDAILKLAKVHGRDFFWLGGGEVDLKWRISTTDFIKFFDPIIADITDIRAE